jgi:serine-type D-Ala-D-Ala carboxypeptidase (penicillin-binding protein 5/6)
MTCRLLLARFAVAMPLSLGLVVGLTVGPAWADTVGGSALASQQVVVDGPPPPSVHAKAWLVADADTGEVLAAYRAHRKLRPASTLKTLTADTLLPRLNPLTGYRASYSDAVAEGSRVGLVPGARYTVDQLFYGMFLPSGNDAAHALAQAAGGVPTTIALMRAEARHLQADDTHVVNPSGLDAPSQVSSAYDLALFARAGLARPDFRHYCSTITYAFPGRRAKKPGNPRRTYQIYNQNPMLVDGFAGAIGVKTGYTTLAGRTFVGAAERDGHTMLVTLMGIRDSSAADAESLLNWAFRQHAKLTPVGTLVAPLPSGGDDLRQVSGIGDEPQASGVVTSGRSLRLLHTSLWPLAVLGLLVLAVVLRRRSMARRRTRAAMARRQRALRP